MFDLINCITRYKIRDFIIRYSKKSLISVQKSNFSPRQSLLKNCHIFLTLRTMWNRQAFSCKLYQILTFFRPAISKILLFFHFMFTIYALSRLFFQYDLFLELIKISYFKRQYLNHRFPYDIANFCMKRLCFLEYYGKNNLNTLWILHTELSLIGTNP